MMKWIEKILINASIQQPDGRPLHCYPFEPDQITGLEQHLRQHLIAGQEPTAIAPGFVFWAAELIRVEFKGGQLTWDFVFRHLGIQEERILGVQLVEYGLAWWRREVKRSEAGNRMFLYSLMAEGGLPQVLLQQQGLYRRVMMGLLSEIEAEGGRGVAYLAEQIATRKIRALPQIFQNIDFVRLLTDLAIALVELRAILPVELNGEDAEQWLNKHRHNWISELPLRMTKEVAETLIRPALRETRNPQESVVIPLATRMLMQNESGCWKSFLRLTDEGWLPVQAYPGAEGLRLRLLPVGACQTVSLSYSAAPESAGWRLNRFGGRGEELIPMDLQDSFVFAAFADGQIKGEAVIDPGLPPSAEVPSFWRASDPSDGLTATRLELQSGSGRTRTSCLWILATKGITPEVHGGLTIIGPEDGPGGWLWRLSGVGRIHFGPTHLRVETGTKEDAPDARLHGFGGVLEGWRLAGGAPIYCGELKVYGEIGTGGLRPIPTGELRRRRGRSLCSEIVEWLRAGEVMARFRYFRLPAAARIDLWEKAPGHVALRAEGLETGWHLTLQAGRCKEGGEVKAERIELSLIVTGVFPGVVSLRLSDPLQGASLEIHAVWPARKVMILDPDGIRLVMNRPLVPETLLGWRAVVPRDMRGELQLRLNRRQDGICLPVTGEVSLAAYQPLIWAMLAQGGPDALVYLSLVVGGEESRRLEIRHYHKQTAIRNHILLLENERELLFDSGTVPTIDPLKGCLRLHAVDVTDPEHVVLIEDAPSRDFRELLGDENGPWLIQLRLNHQILRAVFWAVHPLPPSSRDSRIGKYATKWQRLVAAPEDPEWNQMWRLITAVKQGGDAGVLDQVQALVKAPSAAIALLLRVPSRDLSDLLAMDTAAPIFWPILPVAAFAEAVKAEFDRQVALHFKFFDDQEAVIEPSERLARRIGAILTRKPELGAHFDWALLSAGLPRFSLVDGVNNAPCSLQILNPVKRLHELTQDAARRFDWLPSGMGLLKSPCYPPEFSSFGPYLQRLIDAPFVAAEMAVGRRAAPNMAETLTLINLRLLDSIYFDSALPAALTLCLTEYSQ